MIRINLLGEDTARDPRGVLFVAGYAASMVLLIAVCVVLQISVSGKVAEATLQASELESELAKLQETTKAVKEYEKKKQELTTKLSIIARLKLSKIGPVRVMSDLNDAIPPAAWITEIREKSNVLKIQGFALDPQTVSLFLTKLEKSEYYKTVDLDEAKGVTVKGVKMQAFKVNANIDYAGDVPMLVTEEDGKKGKKERMAQLRENPRG